MGSNNIFFFSRLAELLEAETENYLKMDPDPFDDRNPSRNPNCSFGHMLKVIFKKDLFMQKASDKICLNYVFNNNNFI